MSVTASTARRHYEATGKTYVPAPTDVPGLTPAEAIFPGRKRGQESDGSLFDLTDIPSYRSTFHLSARHPTIA
jgi:hypothetical protein